MVSHAQNVTFERIEKESERDIIMCNAGNYQFQPESRVCRTADTMTCNTSRNSIYPKPLTSARAQLESSINGETEPIDIHSDIVPLNCNVKSYHTGTHTDITNDNCENINNARGGVLVRRSRFGKES